MSARHSEIIKRPGLIIPEAALRRRSICYSGSAPPVLTFVSSSQNTLGTGTHTGMNFGAPSAKRYLLAALGSGTITGVTIGGVTATKLIDVISPFANARSAIYIAAVPTGTSGDVVISTSSITAVALYSVVGLNSATPVATDSNGGNSPLSLSTAVSSLGIVIATCFSAGRFSPSMAAWTGLTTTDVNVALDASTLHSAASYQAAGATTLAMTVTLTTTNAFSACAVSLR